MRDIAGVGGGCNRTVLYLECSDVNYPNSMPLLSGWVLLVYKLYLNKASLHLKSDFGELQLDSIHMKFR